jgi:hypothetical protein
MNVVTRLREFSNRYASLPIWGGFMGYLIRHLAMNLEGNIVAAAEFEKRVHIWDVNTATRVATFETKLDFGGRRLAISPEGSFCAVGAYNRYGVSLYAIDNGSVIWNRKDLKRVQFISFNNSDGNILVGMDEKPLHILDLMSGSTLETIRGAKRKWMSLYDNVYLLEKGSRLDLSRCNRFLTSLQRTTFAILSITFSKEMIYISEAGGPISAYWLTNGNLAWRKSPGNGYHFLNIHYHSVTNNIYGVLWSYEKGGPKYICVIESSSGAIKNKLQLHEQTTETVFSKKGSYFLTSNGDVYNLDEEIPRRFRRLSWDGNDA